jgi:hypothetical protein
MYAVTIRSRDDAVAQSNCSTLQSTQMLQMPCRVSTTLGPARIPSRACLQPGNGIRLPQSTTTKLKHTVNAATPMCTTTHPPPIGYTAPASLVNDPISAVVAAVKPPICVAGLDSLVVVIEPVAPPKVPLLPAELVVGSTVLESAVFGGTNVEMSR